MADGARGAAPTKLVPVDGSNRAAVLALKVKVAQTSLVASTAKSLRQAAEKPRLVPRAFLEGERVAARVRRHPCGP